MNDKQNEKKSYFNFKMIDIRLFPTLETVQNMCQVAKCKNRASVIVQDHYENATMTIKRFCKEHLKTYIEEVNKNYERILPILEESEKLFDELENKRKEYY